MMDFGDGTEGRVLIGTLEQINAGLANLSFTPADGFSGPVTFSMTVNDQGNTGTGGQQSATTRLTLNVVALSEPPAIEAPDTATTDEDNAFAFSGQSLISIDDPDAGAADISVTLQVSNGGLGSSATAPMDLTVDPGMDLGPDGEVRMLTLSGAQDDINTYLAGLLYTPDANFNGTDQLLITSDDQGDSPAPGATDMATVDITVNAVNDPIMVTVPVPDDSFGLGSADTSEGAMDQVSNTLAGAFELSRGNFLIGVEPNANVGDDSLPLHTITGNINSNNDIDFFRVQLNQGEALTLDVDGGSGGSANDVLTRVSVFDSNGNLLLDEDAGSVLAGGDGSIFHRDPFTHFVAPTTGEYAFAISNDQNRPLGTVTGGEPDYSGNGTDTGDYTLRLSLNPRLSVEEDGMLVFAADGPQALSISDADLARGEGSGEASVSLRVFFGTLTLASTEGLTLGVGTSNNGTENTLEFTGTQAAINNALDGLIYRPNPNVNSTSQSSGSNPSGVDTLTLFVNDQGNNPAPQTNAMEDVFINIVPVNDAPGLTVPTDPQVTNEDSPLSISGITVADADLEDGGSAQLRLGITTTSGTATLTLSDVTGLSFVGGANGGTGFAVQGSVDDLNAALATLEYAPAPGFEGNDSLNLNLGDLGNFPNGSANDNRSIPISVIGGNDGPVINVTGGTAQPVQAIPETTDANNLFNDAGVQFIARDSFNVDPSPDVGTGREPRVQIVGAIDPDNDQDLYGVELREGDVLTIDIDGARIEQVSGIDSLVRVRDGNGDLIVGAENDDSPNAPDNGSASTLDSFLVFTAPSDGNFFIEVDNSELIADQTGPYTLQLSLQPAPLTIAEDTPLTLTSLSVADADLADTPGATLLTTVSVNNGTLTVAAGSGATITDDGSAIVTLEGDAAQVNAALNGLVYQGNPDFNGSDTLTLTVNDQGATGTPGPLITTTTLGIEVTAVNDAPVINTASDPAAMPPVVAMPFTLTPENEPVNDDFQNALANPIGRAQFQVSPTDLVGVTDQSRPRISIEGEIGGPNGNNDVDYYAFELAAGENITFDVDFGHIFGTFEGDSIDTVIRVFDAGGVQLATNDDVVSGTGGAGSGSGLDPYLEFTAPSAGTYVLSVTNLGNDPVSNSPDANGNPVFDNGGNDTGTYTLQVSRDNPVLSTSENTSLAIPNLSVADVDVDEDPDAPTTGRLQVLVLVDQQGTLSISQTDGLSVSSNNSNLVNISGTVANVNAALASLSYTPATDFDGIETLSMTVIDLGNTGAGGQRTTTTEIRINVIGENIAPVINVTGGIAAPVVPIGETEPNDTIANATLIDRTAFQVQDSVDVGDDSLPRVQIQAAINPDNDFDFYAIDLRADETLTVDVDYASDGNNFTSVDSLLSVLDSSGAELASNDDSAVSDGGQGSTATIGLPGSTLDSFLQFTAPTAGTYYVRVNDFVANASGPYTLQLSLQTAPLTIAEDSPLTLTSLSVADADLADTPDATLLTTVSVDNGTLTVAAGSGATITDDGSATVTLEGDATQVNAALNGLVYQGNPDFNGSDTLTLTVNDQGATGTPGPLITTTTLGIEVTAINDAPVINTFGATATAFAVTPENEPANGGFRNALDNPIGRAQFQVSPTDLVTAQSLPRISIEGEIGGPNGNNDVDYYAFELAAGENITFDVDFGHIFGTSEGDSIDTEIRVFDAGGVQLDVNDDDSITLGGAGSESVRDPYLEFTAPTAGTYVLSLADFENDPVANSPDANGNPVFDKGGNDTGTYTLQVSRDNPVLSTLENTALAIPNLSVADVDVDEDPDAPTTGLLQVLVRVDQQGTLSISQTDGLSVSVNNSNLVNFTGTVADVNAALASLSYNPATDFDGIETLSMTVIDLGNTGAGGQRTTTTEISINVVDPTVFDLGTLEQGDGSTGFVLNGIAVGDYSGRSVSSAGDVNGDGFDDLLIGASGADPNGPNSGQSYVVFGGSGLSGEVDLGMLGMPNNPGGFTLNGIAGGDLSGFSVSGAGDVNGDGFGDLLIGAFGADPNGLNSGQSYVVFGGSSLSGPVNLADLNTANNPGGFALNGIAQNDFSGRSVSSAGDVNGDGFDDLLIGADRADPNGASSGQSYVVFGGSGLSGEVDLGALGTPGNPGGFTLNGIAQADLSGRSVSSAGDVNGDGFDDLLIGAEGAGPNGDLSAGQSYVVFGGSGLSGSTVELGMLGTPGNPGGFALNGIAGGDYSGRSVSSAGDVNGDGFDDLLIGAHYADPNGESSGQSYLVYGGDFLDQIDAALLGTDGDDSLTGTAADESLVGGQGADTLDGAGGNDVLIGGEGDDVLVYDANDTLRVDGGNGFDTLRATGSDNIDFTALREGLFGSIERLDLTNSTEGASASNTVTLDLLDLLDITEREHRLIVDGTADDVLNLGEGFARDMDADQNIGATDYSAYTVMGVNAVVLVDPAMTVDL